METSGRGWDRLPALLFLTAAVAAVALLIAGYGVAVGVGALVGLMLGFLAGSLGLLWLARGSGRSITFGRSFVSSDEARPSAELMAEMRDASEVETVDIGPIRSIVPVVDTAEAAGLAAQLVTVEIHEAGLAMTLDVRSRPGTPPPPPIAHVSVADDRGTTYRAGAQFHGGFPVPMRFGITAIPAPPPAATRLEVAIDRFLDPFPGGRSSVTGPWRFTVALPMSRGSD